MDEKKVGEAKIFIKTLITAGNGDERLYTAIEALEKQLPKKVVDRSIVKDNGIVVGFIGRCPNCNEIIDSTTTVCDCGQQLDCTE